MEQFGILKEALGAHFSKYLQPFILFKTIIYILTGYMQIYFIFYFPYENKQKPLTLEQLTGQRKMA